MGKCDYWKKYKEWVQLTVASQKFPNIYTDSSHPSAMNSQHYSHTVVLLLKRPP